MIDIGLLASVVIMLTVPVVFVTPWPQSAVAAGLVETASGALMIGLVVGRLTALAIDDAGSLTNLSDVMIVRSGVEFWPGVLAAVMWLSFQARRDGVTTSLRLAALAPAGLIAWALFEATCLLREGCPGPASVIGLRPDGLVTRMFPVGLAVAVAASASAFAIDRTHRRGMGTRHVVVLAVAAVALIRSVASFWLPHIGSGLTRQHRASLAVLGASVVALGIARVRRLSVLRAVPSE